MKKIYLILSVFAIVFIACETDFDVNATWEEVVVVYGLLDTGEGKELQQIKISKAFLGEMDALQMAQYAGSINFDPNHLNVKIYKLEDDIIIDSVSLFAVPTFRDGDLFYDTIMIYTFENTDVFLHSDSEYELVIENKISGNVVSGNTEIISGFSFDGLSNSPFGFYRNLSNLADSARYSSKLLKWNACTNGKIYQADMIFEYTEDDDTIKLTWSQPLVTSDGNAMNILLEGKKFFTFLRNSITKDDAKVREFLNIDLIMTVGTTDLETYINVNQPITGIVQERPQFTNISGADGNGIGIFSSRFSHIESDVTLSDWTKEYLIEELDRNFVLPDDLAVN